MSGQSGPEGVQLLSYVLEGELFAVEIDKIREVLEFNGATRIPDMPEFMRGVINLRGSVVPVIDLKTRFGIGRTEKGVNTCVIITEVEVDGERMVLGALADAVQEVFRLNEMVPPPKVGTRVDTGFVMGMGRHNDSFVIVLDVEKIFSGMTLATVANLAAGGVAG